MSENLKGFTINEGYTDLGTISVNISRVEEPLVPTEFVSNEPEASRTSIFRLIDTEGDSLPDDILAKFQINTLGEDEKPEYETYTARGGFVELNFPKLSMVPRLDEGRFLIQVEMGPAPENRQQECYLAVLNEEDETLYTMSGELGVSDGFLGVYTDETSFYKSAQNIAVDGAITAIYITAKGRVYGYDTDATPDSWQLLDTLEYNQFQRPENLISEAEGVYRTSGGSGTITTDILGEGSFELFTLAVLNPEIYYIDINLRVYRSGDPDPIYDSKIGNILPGDRNYKPITVSYTPLPAADNSPTLTDIETISGLEFSADFKNFLVDEELNTMKALAAVGPIAFIIGLPEMEEDDEKLQNYVDLYAITNNLEFSQRLTSIGYNNVYDIANTPRSIFVENVIDEIDPTINIYKAGEIHYTSVERLNLLSNIVGAAVTDFRLENNVFGPQGQIISERNSFGNYLSETFFSSCSCDDCKSGVSPFSYLTDLVKYAAHHITKTGSGAYTPTNYTNFLILLRNKFFQPYDTLPISCETLHEEFCRVRLVTEILEKLVDANVGSISAARLARLEEDRNNYLQLTYNTLLTQAGTSFNEVRSVFITVDNAEKKIKAEKLAQKLGIPLYIPLTSDYTTDKLWLSFSETGDNLLTAAHLESVFGFRKTVTPTTSDSDMEIWRAAHMRDVWKNMDYPLSAYTREGVEGTGSGFVYQDNWMPIVDPDIMGIGDMSYLADEVLLALWQNRKVHIDQFLTYYTSDSAILARTSADVQNRIIKVDNLNIANHVIEDDEIKLSDNGSSWTVFNLLSRSLLGSEINFALESGTGQQPMFQPHGTTPKMRYMRRLLVTNAGAPGTSMTITLNSKADLALPGGALKFVSYDGATPVGSFQTSDGSITGVTIDGTTTVNLTLNDTPDTPFMDGTKYFIYEVEIPLVTDLIPTPIEVVDKLFDDWTYEYLVPTPAGFTPDPYVYKIFTAPTSWPGIIDSIVGNYSKLKALRQIITAGTIDTTPYVAVVTDNLHMDLSSFNRMMDLFASIDAYLKTTYTTIRPSVNELYELASIFNNAGKNIYQFAWIKEETEYIPTGGVDPIITRLLTSKFSISMEEPISGVWDPSLQSAAVPIIDPELITRNELQEGISQEPYFDIYDDRTATLDAKFVTYLGWVTDNTFDIDAITKALKEINTDSTSGTIIYSPYSNLNNLYEEVQIANDAFKKRAAVEKVFSLFGMTEEDFLEMMGIKIAYEGSNPSQFPSDFELKKLAGILTSGYKVVQLYPIWLAEEVTDEVFYYNVLKMKMAPVRGNYSLRGEWQRTLKAWNKRPVVEPDIVGAENIRAFISGNVAHDAWLDFWTQLYVTESTSPTVDGLYKRISEEWLNPSVVPESDQLENYQKLLCWAFFGASMDDPSFADYLPYFDAIKEREEAGEDIRPRLAYMGVDITQYRSLRRIYEVMVDTVGSFPLIQSEYDEMWDVFYCILKQKKWYGIKTIEQYDENILLDDDEFRMYKPSTVNFPLTDLPLFNEHRFPLKARKEWLDLLEARKEIEQTAKDAWKTVLEETEERTMRVLRDGLILALSRDCEPFDAVAERLAKTLFIETEDNCCAKHTRVSQAIETLQGFIYSLKSGIYDNYLTGFSLSANNFNEEWEWLGSYATWRAAMFTFLYPENLLYPTLRKKQSPGILRLAQKLQDNSRFSPAMACAAGKEYEDYFRDVYSLDIRFTVSCWASTYKEDSNGCCDDITEDQYTDFFFATSKISGKHYWCTKLYADNSGQTHGYWQELPIKSGTTLVGCFPLPVRNENNTLDGPLNVLRLFYSYLDNEELKLATIEKTISTPSSWGGEIEVAEFPSEAGDIDLGQAYSVVACQSSMGWDWPSFIISYKRGTNSGLHLHLRYWDHKNEWDLGTLNTGNHFLSGDLRKPIAAIRHSAGNQSTERLYAVTTVFEDKIHILNFEQDHLWAKIIMLGSINMEQIFGAFQSRSSFSTIQIVYLEKWTGVLKVINFTLTPDQNDYITITVNNPTLLSFPGNLLEICPVFSQEHRAVFGFNVLEQLCFSVSTNYVGGVLSFKNYINLVPVIREGISAPIQSGECVADYAERIFLIKDNFINNMNSITGVVNYQTTQSPVNIEYLKEAYYFVPMLLALDQQQRGQYESALDWYRTVYNYTVSGNNPKRKVYYGLVIEQSIQTVYSRPQDWLLDPLNPHLIAGTRANAYTKYTVMNIVQCILSLADREYTSDTVETVPRARMLYTTALELLGIPELKLVSGVCEGLVPCFPTSISFANTQFSSLFSVMQDQLLSLGNYVTVGEAYEEIIAIFEDEGLDVLEQFTQAFEVINDAKEPESVQDLTALIGSSSQRFNEIFSFVSAFPALGDSLNLINQQASQGFSSTMANLLGVSSTELETEGALERMLWLTTSRDITEIYQFEFADSSGMQLMPGDKGYNPLRPTSRGLHANLDYTNATVILDGRTPYSPSYIPLIDVAYCVPLNPIYTSLQLKANLELYKIQNCRNIAGMVRELEIYAAPTDSTTGIPVIGSSGSLTFPGLNKFRPSQYRFSVLMERAKQITSQAQQLESQFLSILERRDAEYYSQLKARQDLQTAKSTVRLQDLRVRQANNERDMANLQLDKVTFVQGNFETLINAGLSAFEQTSLDLMKASTILLGISAATGLSGSVAAVYDMRSSAASILNIITGSLRDIATVLSSTSSYLSQMASYERRAQEWEYQKELAGYDITIANQQIKISEDNIRIVSQEREISQLYTDHAQDTLEFLMNKFTNAELYNWMSTILERTYGYMLNLATSVARTAEGQLYFERQEFAGPFILDDYWEAPSSNVMSGSDTVSDRRGLTGSTRLLQDIYRLDQYAFDTDKRKLQLTKTISLAQNFPEAFQKFRETGILNFELTNKMFDYDFPGHYLRLVRSVKTTVVGLVPVYGGIKATLTAEPISYTVIGGTIFQKQPIKRMEIDSVALTSPNSANGLFELQPTQGEMLNPFEGMGVESRWEFKMPKFSNRMDYEQMADVLITLEYTALDNFQYRYQVLQDLDSSPSFMRAFSFKNNFPDQWFDLSNAPDNTDTFKVTFTTKKEDFPQGFSEIRFSDRLLLYFVREDGFTEEIDVEDFKYLPTLPTDPLFGDTTTNGRYVAENLAYQLGGLSPFRTWQLTFDNTPQNRALFIEGKIKDILFVMTCVGDLPIYPL